MTWFARLNRPWIHFILLGFALFYLQGVLFPEPKPVIGPLNESRIETLVQQWFKATGRLPGEEQQARMVDAELDRDMLFQRALELELLALEQKFSGNEARDLYGDLGPVSVSRRICVAMLGTFRSTYGPTQTHQAVVQIARKDFADVKTRMQRIKDTDMPALQAELNQAVGLWTPVRGVPGGD